MANSVSDRNGVLGFKTRRLDRRALILISTVLLVAIVVLRFAVVSPTEAVLLLCVVPIAMIAMEFGTAGGLIAASLCFGIAVLYSVITGFQLGFWGYLSRGASFYFVGALIGRFIEQRRALEERHTRWFEMASDLSCTAGFDGYFKSVNPAWRRTFGYSAEEIMSRPFVEFVHPDDRENTIAESARLVTESAETVSFVNRYRAKGGSYRWIEWTASVAPDEQLIYASARDITERKRLEDQLQRLAQHDSLTGLYNRRRFEEELDRQIDFVQRHGSGGAVLMFDLDHFKLINDSRGHAAGDEALRTAARVLQETLRGTDISGRFGGDEFAVILPETDTAGAELVAQKLVTNVRQRTANVEREVNPTVSIGIALFGAHDHRSKEDVLRAADEAMYEAKRAGGDRCSARSASLT
jgi:diguanylate cyclase (GGDEF)-like protein/PAS domain S-box-containing protein